ncbi:hypothetical protein FBEOM_12188 [Fusarium beomiforme]|uniref:Uncharacterized protein n=1 Tax=Fusarium beomiforme TaxID=44412 RepID=A0A9P5A9N8_9HYPO|nr:hypothetical protein FBEOM_12188 [Fusarium beomiforme]
MVLVQTRVSALTLSHEAAPPYRLAHLANLTLGYTIYPSWSHKEGALPMAASPPPSPPTDGSPPPFKPTIMNNAIHTQAGVYSVRQLVAATSPLLNAIVASLGQDRPGERPASSVLIDGLAASLATSGRESTLPLVYSPQDTARRDIVLQANKIAKTLVRYVHDSVNPPSANNHQARLRSPCEGHLWTPAVAALLLGPRSNSHLMELYNEWLHRMILLRDSLLPFENYENVPLVIPAGSDRGIRDLEEPRKLFLVHCLTGTIQHTAIVDLAKVFTARHLPRGGYGFQYSQGLILPAFLSGSPSLHLLRWHPAHVYDSEPEVLFDYEHKEYINAPRSELVADEAAVSGDSSWNLTPLLRVDSRVTESSLAIDAGNDALRRIVKLRLTLDSGTSVSVDLGQIARGRRYAYEVKPENRVNGTSLPKDSANQSPVLNASSGFHKAIYHNAADILRRPGLVISPRAVSGHGNTIHIIPTQDPILKLALLGKFYPENVILSKDKYDPDAVGKTGKGFADRLVILDQIAERL